MNVACTQCGAPSLRGNRFCGRCGSPLPPSTGNLPTSTPGSPPQRAPAPIAPGATTQASASPCWQCGGPVDLLHQVTCANCGARLVAGPPEAAAVPSYSTPQPGAAVPTCGRDRRAGRPADRCGIGGPGGSQGAPAQRGRAHLDRGDLDRPGPGHRGDRRRTGHLRPACRGRMHGGPVGPGSGPRRPLIWRDTPPMVRVHRAGSAALGFGSRCWFRLHPPLGVVRRRRKRHG